jgi:hypothetical protein
MADLSTAGTLLAQSQMFGIRTAADGFVVAATCHQQGISLMQFIETYHIVEGRPSMRADAMLARLLELGGEYEIISRTPEKAEIRATFGKASGVFAFTWEDAQAEPFPWGKEKDGKRVLKKNWATPRARMQMLWARAVSDAVRTVCPLANRGTYTPEEVRDFGDDIHDLGAAPQTISAEEAAARAASSGTVIEAEVVEPEAAPDYTRCPVGGPGWIGRPWEEFATSALQAALASAGLGDEYKAEVKAILAKRGA